MVLIMNKPTLNLKDIVADCEFEFWDRVATKHMPLVRSGDFDPMQAYALEQALENAIRHWWRWNGEEHYNLKDGVDILEGEKIKKRQHKLRDHKIPFFWPRFWNRFCAASTWAQVLDQIFTIIERRRKRTQKNAKNLKRPGTQNAGNGLTWLMLWVRLHQKNSMAGSW
jgi:hypothetical protein